MFTLALILSIRPIRSRFYETFLLSHLLLIAGSLLSLYYHQTEINHWIKAGVALWAMDRGVRMIKWIMINKMWQGKRQDVKVEVMEGDVMRLTVRGSALKWSPGQHA